MRRNPVAYVRGKISHLDHATIRLDGWHRVAMNTESQSSTVAFLDCTWQGLIEITPHRLVRAAGVFLYA